MAIPCVCNVLHLSNFLMEDDEDHEGPNRYDDAVFGLDGIIIAKFMKS